MPEIELCTWLRRGIMHVRSCTEKVANRCVICKKVVSICCYHSKYCEDEECLVPFCVDIKGKMREREASGRYSHQLIICTRAAQKFTVSAQFYKTLM